MDAIAELFKQDFSSIVLSIFVIMAGFNAACDILDKFSKKLGKPIKWLKKNNEDHELLLTTRRELSELKTKHNEDIKHNVENDDKVENELFAFMTEMRSEMKQYSDNRIHDRQQSFDIQKELTEAQAAIAKYVEEISQKLDTLKQDTDERFYASEEKENKRVQAEIKDKIAQLYRRYGKNKEITSMELEALEDLITTYEEHGGENSFVHSVVQKEMYTWNLIQ